MLPVNKAAWHLPEQIDSKLFVGAAFTRPEVKTRELHVGIFFSSFETLGWIPAHPMRLITFCLHTDLSDIEIHVF